MDIIKKDGRLEKFNIEKLKTSIENSATDIEVSLTESDLNIITKYAYDIITDTRKENSNTSSYEVRGITIEALLKNGFNSVVYKYLGLNK